MAQFKLLFLEMRDSHAFLGVKLGQKNRALITEWRSYHDDRRVGCDDIILRDSAFVRYVALKTKGRR